ncbi:MAG: hypothetical protein GC150_07700 [Rhizobiales bacterium]|nr:hypothetical protein [Hyphomicrobiales bacterium]
MSGGLAAALAFLAASTFTLVGGWSVATAGELRGGTNAATVGLPAPILSEWQSDELQDHPLVGRVWSREADGLVAPRTMIEALLGTDFALLGEVHDNGDAHRIQALAVEALAQRRRRPPAVVMEMVRNDQTANLPDGTSGTLAPQAATIAADAFFEGVSWEASGWPDRTLYRPLIEAIMGSGLAIRPGSDTRERVRQLARQGPAALDEATRRALGLDADLEAPLGEALVDELVVGHCNLMPADAMAPMVSVQRYRDGWMAAALVAADAGGGAVLIAGNGHVRDDRGVAWYLRRLAPTRHIVSVVVIEVSADAMDPAGYVPRDPQGRAAADFAVFVPRAERADPCEDLRKRFGKSAG